jgi:hypothetical protein
MGLHKIKKLFRTKEIVSKLKRTPKEWEKIYRKLKKLNYPQINEPIKKWATELNRTFSKEEIQMAKKHMKNAHHP